MDYKSLSKQRFGWLCWGLTSQSTIFQSYRDGAIASWVINQYFRGVKCLAQGHNTAAVGLEPRTSRSGVRHSTTEPPRSPQNNETGKIRFVAGPTYDTGFYEGCSGSSWNLIIEHFRKQVALSALTYRFSPFVLWELADFDYQWGSGWGGLEFCNH